ncbi:ketopantoate reductase C-terminal domain-containing protein [Paenibacillus sp. E194]|uniref:ketopantoate reductase C-terminal domain-containing protein n=1 Tax=Paenibacillus sp. E194 TaxID=1458845 RepID=UPI001E4AAC6A|nr:ketopantoate reductase C-terminal domain-containing protein [Paenibacillus sp. E194]
MVYQKLLANVIINPLTAVLRIKNGQLLLQEDRLSLMKELFGEAAAVYRAAHISIDEEKDWERVVQVCRMTSSNSSSMLQDVEAGRRTEIEAITGALIRMADRYEVAVPLHRMMYRLILASCE